MTQTNTAAERYRLVVYLDSSNKTALTVEGAANAAEICANWLAQDWRRGNPVCVYDLQTRSANPKIASLGDRNPANDFHTSHTRGARAFSAAFDGA